MLIMALKPPVVSEQLRSLDHDDAVLAQLVGAAQQVFSLTSSFLDHPEGCRSSGKHGYIKGGREARHARSS
jgi:hypothetical protein